MRIESRPSSRGYKVPWFVHWENGEPDFRVVAAGKFLQAVRNQLCWICGYRLGAYKAFVVGPMCAINRTSSDPPSHWSCAQYAAINCPFLNNPDFQRREGGLPDEIKAPPGVFIRRNPGITLIWVTKRYQLFNAPGGLLIEMGTPEDLHWYREGRLATRQEVMDSIESGCPVLRTVAEEEGPAAVAEYETCKQWVLERIPV